MKNKKKLYYVFWENPKNERDSGYQGPYNEHDAEVVKNNKLRANEDSKVKYDYWVDTL